MSRENSYRSSTLLGFLTRMRSDEAVRGVANVLLSSKVCNNIDRLLVASVLSLGCHRAYRDCVIARDNKVRPFLFILIALELDSKCVFVDCTVQCHFGDLHWGTITGQQYVKSGLGWPSGFNNAEHIASSVWNSAGASQNHISVSNELTGKHAINLSATCMRVKD
jgi:hypothetical protein